YTASYYLHELRTPESYRGDNYSDAGGLHGGKAKLYGHDSLELFRMAEQHRRSGQSVSKALSAMQFKEARNVVAAVSLLVHAGLCTRISASA
ncbi:hypothetical protein, partial [Paracidovorax avenae]